VTLPESIADLPEVQEYRLAVRVEDKGWPLIMVPERAADAALEAVGRWATENCVEKSWPGLMTILDDIYPARVFGGVDEDWSDETRDIGPRLVTLARHLDALRGELAEARDKQRKAQRLHEAAEKALTQMRRHPNSKLDDVDGYYYRLGKASAEADLAARYEKEDTDG
jgi:hypothetical protein